MLFNLLVLNTNNNFFSLKLSSQNNNTIIMYKKEDIWLKPECFEISHLEISNEINNCFEDIPILTFSH